MSAGRRRLVPVVAALLACALPACGYRLVGVGGQLPGGINRVEVPIFQNRTTRNDVGRILTEDFISQLLASGKVQTARGEAAQAVIEGVVTAYRKDPITFDAKQVPLENRLTIVMDVSLVSRSEKKRVLFAERNVTLHVDYPVKSDLQVNDRAEEDALHSASKQMSQKLVSLMLEGF